MTEPLLALSIASAIVDLISITSSIVATLHSSAYNNERILRDIREAGDGRDKLNRCLRLLGDLKQPSRLLSKAFWPDERDCWTLLQQTPSAAACLPSRIRKKTGNRYSVAFARYMNCITAHCRERTKHTPMFWRLQSWISRTAMDRLPSPVYDWFATSSMVNPTPNGLLLSWIVLAVAIATYYRSRAGFRYERYYLIGSIAGACVVGVLESSDRAAVILMDIPWCLTIGIMLHIIVRSTSRRLEARRIRRKDVPCGLSTMVLSQDIEKIAGNDNLSKSHGA